VSRSASPLGRFDPTADESELTEVRLLNMPLEVLSASREHHDGLMREFRLMALARKVPEDAAPSRLLDLVQVLGVQFAGTSARPDQAIDEALDRGESVIDLTYLVPQGVAAAAQALDTLMREADDFCRDEQLLTLARPALLVDFAAWYLRCFVDQLAGGAPEPWTGPLSL
jgi:hypothetical protein